MKSNLWTTALCGLFLTVHAMPGFSTQQVVGTERRSRPVNVELASGRAFSAEIDPHTDATDLWLRWGPGSKTMLRPIHWERVVRVGFAGRTFSGEEFRQAVISLGKRTGSTAVTGHWSSNSPHIQSDGPTSPGSQPLAEAERVSPPASTETSDSRAPRRVQSLAIDAGVANWDADVEADGLVVDVYPLDAVGAVVPVSGTIRIDLTGWRNGVVQLEQPFGRLGHWTRQVRTSDAGSGGSRYRLPFQSVHPEFNLEWMPHGLVHARLTVPGQGVFETTASTVRIRPYSAARDQLQQITGHRFFPMERTGQGNR